MGPLAWLLSLGSLVLFAIVVAHLVIAMVLIIPTWRICTRAGYSGALSLFHLVPLVGAFIVMAILAFGDWPNGEAGGAQARAGSAPPAGGA